VGPEGPGACPAPPTESAPDNTRGMIHWVAHAAGFLQFCGASGERPHVPSYRVKC